MTDKICILQDDNCEMLDISINGKGFFHGNYWDFHFPEDLIDLFKKLDVEVYLREKDYDEWY